MESLDFRESIGSGESLDFGVLALEAFKASSEPLLLFMRAHL
ncbi:hypothetical protein CGSMWGv00703Dmash_00074 [Gardnerella greenwoodii 00703Dmash]|uniref:Uncharacterized protein n=1 Tax=Gardnerella greenwoodii 00703Dmash TaxID=698960 RepID=I4MBS9_9BIFI|nr:hypothetical protein CGSMWGv00703Dmash_00074 [Gardnerella greenwoodii 00703Dmash]